MKRLLVFSICLVVLSGCTVTNYSGKIYPSTVEFNKGNFKYIKTIKGSAEASYSYGGWDSEKSDGLVNEAKTNMYYQHPLKENQVPTNITVDILREGEPNFGSNSIELRKVKVIITADIFEFSENGVYSKNETTSINKQVLETKPSKKYDEELKIGDSVYFEDINNKYKKTKAVIIGNSKYYFTIEYVAKNGKTKNRDIDKTKIIVK